MTNLARHLISHDHRSGALEYRFPNGQEVSVIPDPVTPMRWEVRADWWPVSRAALTSEEADALLAELAAMPMPEWDGKS